jgi:hypothetical protein
MSPRSEASQASRQTIESLHLATMKKLEQVGFFSKFLKRQEQGAKMDKEAGLPPENVDRALSWTKDEFMRPYIEVVLLPTLRALIDAADRSNGSAVVTKADLIGAVDLRPIAHESRLTIRQVRLVQDAVLHQAYEGEVFAGQGLPLMRDKKTYRVRGSGAGLTVSRE